MYILFVCIYTHVFNLSACTSTYSAMRVYMYVNMYVYTYIYIHEKQRNVSMHIYIYIHMYTPACITGLCTVFENRTSKEASVKRLHAELEQTPVT